MLSSPLPVRNVPDGLAVMFSLPIGAGFTPAISRFETAQPMATREDSSMETSMKLALPGSLAPEQRRRDRKRGGNAAHRVGNGVADPRARIARRR